VDFAREAVHSFREFDGVGDEVAGGVAGFGGPAVVDVNVSVAEVAQAEVDEGFGGLQDYGGGGGVAAALVLGLLVVCLGVGRGDWHTQEFQPSAGVRPSPFSRRFSTATACAETPERRAPSTTISWANILAVMTMESDMQMVLCVWVRHKILELGHKVLFLFLTSSPAMFCKSRVPPKGRGRGRGRCDRKRVQPGRCRSRFINRNIQKEGRIIAPLSQEAHQPERAAKE